MRFLFDTHILLWSALDSPRLPKEARLLIEDRSSRLVFSAVSIWEVAVKSGLARDSFNSDPRVLLRALRDNGYEELSMTSSHTLMAAGLPPFHKDPFDRMLVAQAIDEGLTLVTADRVLSRYDAPVKLV